ncbi:MAG: VWA domain-containing protein [Blastocatellia bacterium]|nr:VWA domain-containing protein [Blastocatellia bacterium]
MIYDVKKRFLALSLMVILLALPILGQSGRRIEKPQQPVAETVTRAPDFSESRPLPIRASQPGAGFRNVQSAGAPAPNRGEADAEDADGEEGEIIRVDTRLVSVPVSVYDRNGLYMPNLGKENFTIFDQGVEQEVAYFGTSEAPFTVLLLIDTSPSAAYKMEDIHAAAIAFVDQLKPQDQVIVVEFDQRVRVHTTATSDRRRIERAIKRARFGSGTSLYDAVDVSMRKHIAGVEGRKAIVLFTDGVDTTSRRATYDTTLDFAEESDTPVFTIYYNTFIETRRGVGGGNWPFPESRAPRGTTAAEYAVGRKYVAELSNYTGGRVYEPGSTALGLTTAFTNIAEELRRQYLIGFIPSETGSGGERRQIRVRVNRPNLVIRARDSYIVN